MTATYESILTTTVSSDTSSVSIGSIPSGYTDIVIIAYTKDTRANNGVCDLSIRVNNNNSAIYSGSTINNATGFTIQNSNQWFGSHPGASNTYCVSTYNFQDYLNTNKSKHVVYKYDIMYSSDGNNRICSGVASGVTGALTSVQFIGEHGIKAGSVFTVYGIKAE